MNPLLHLGDTDHAPIDFGAIVPAHIEPAMTTLIAQAQAALQKVCAPDFPATWHDIAKTLHVAVERLDMAWGALSHLSGVADTPELRAAYNAMLPYVSQFYTQLGSSAALHAKTRQIAPQTLNAEQRQALRHALEDLRLGGAQLQGDARARFIQINDRLSVLAQKFSENVLDATEAFTCFVSDEEIMGVPQDVRHSALKAAQEKGECGKYLLTLKAPCYTPVLQHAKSSALRERLYYAYTTRASDLGPPQVDNSAVMLELLALRHEQARLLGFESSAQVSLVPKMARSVQEVERFLRDLAARAKPYALRELEQMRMFAKDTLGIDEPQPWDWTFIAERLKETLFDFSDTEVKNHFQLPNVLSGLFALAERLFGLTVHPDHAPVWDPQVQFFRLEQQGQPIAYFYLDTAARSGKRGGAWMSDVRNRWLRPDNARLQLPIAHLVCNCAEGIDGKAPLLPHADVITLFHEFGHGLHHMLTRVNERSVAGISGVEWDAVELPSQFMENFCWEWTVVRDMSAHVHTAEPIPRVLFDKMVAARNFQSGLHVLRQVEFALFDLLLHAAPVPAQTPGALLALAQQVRAEVAVMPYPGFNRMPHSFSHIFAGDYAAGYYSYHWSEVLSSDCYAVFEQSAEVADTGKRFLDEILSRGGARPAAHSFEAFVGRAPKIDAMLRHCGMAQPL